MRKYGILFTMVFFMTSCSTLQNFISEPSQLETITAVKEVLNSSAFRTVEQLSRISKDGVEGVLPSELQSVLKTLRTMGLGGDIDKVTNTISDASLLVLGESKGILQDAIKEIKFTDAVAIVSGAPDAATIALKNAMYGSVKNRYSAKLNAELDKTEANKYWPMAQSAYNLFSKNKIEGSLSEFLSERAVDAVFIGMGKEEAVIRQNPQDLGKAVVTKVFDYYAKRPS